MVRGRQDRRANGALSLPLPTHRQPLCQRTPLYQVTLRRLRLPLRQVRRPLRRLPLLARPMRHRARDERVPPRGQVVVPGAEGVAADLVM